MRYSSWRRIRVTWENMKDRNIILHDAQSHVDYQRWGKTHTQSHMHTRTPCHTHECIKSYMWMSLSHVSLKRDPREIWILRFDEQGSHYTRECVESHVWTSLSHDTRMNESCHTGMFLWKETQELETIDIQWELIMSHVWMSHVTRMNASWRAYKWVTSHVSVKRDPLYRDLELRFEIWSSDTPDEIGCDHMSSQVVYCKLSISTVWCSVLQCDAESCSMLQRVLAYLHIDVVCCRVFFRCNVLQCVAACCRVLQCVSRMHTSYPLVM